MAAEPLIDEVFVNKVSYDKCTVSCDELRECAHEQGVDVETMDEEELGWFIDRHFYDRFRGDNCEITVYVHRT